VLRDFLAVGLEDAQVIRRSRTRRLIRLEALRAAHLLETDPFRLNRLALHS